MSRLAFILLASTILAGPAQAAVAAKSERGVRVWRAETTIASPTLKHPRAGASCEKTIIVLGDAWPARRLRTHGWTGKSWDERLPLTTTGFFADRIAAGL